LVRLLRQLKSLLNGQQPLLGSHGVGTSTSRAAWHLTDSPKPHFADFSDFFLPAGLKASKACLPPELSNNSRARRKYRETSVSASELGSEKQFCACVYRRSSPLPAGCGVLQ
jgi:hypothetical protein